MAQESNKGWVSLPTTAVVGAKNRIWSSLAACLIWLALENTEWEGEGREEDNSLN